jgi:hypothetical protein
MLRADQLLEYELTGTIIYYFVREYKTSVFMLHRYSIFSDILRVITRRVHVGLMLLTLSDPDSASVIA